MASVARYLGRSAFSFARRRPAAIQSRSFAITPLRFLPEDPPARQERELSAEEHPDMPDYSPDMLSKDERSMYDMLSPEERELFDAEQRRLVEEYNDHAKRAAAFAEIDKSARDMEKEIGLRFEDLPEKNKGFWAEEEDDEFALVEDGDDDFHDDEITSMAHAEVELHREIREYARIAAWDMPLLSKLAQPFTLPPETHILRFRYTTYMGEQHPAEAKVVVEVASKDLVPKHLSEDQRQTFLKLVGPRYNPDTDIVRMSCEKFSTRAENKRYLGDIINTLVKEAKEGDSFADIPLDLRHHKPKPQFRFPETWVMTEERKKQLAARRRERLAREQERQSIVDGNAVVALASRSLPSLNPALSARAAEEREKVAVKVSGKGMKKRVR